MSDAKSQRKRRVRSRIRGTAKRPRLSMFRSGKYTYAQLVDDEAGKTLAFASSKETKLDAKLTKTETAEQVGKAIALKAKELGIESAVADRGSYRYHGRIKALVEGARKEGLKI